MHTHIVWWNLCFVKNSLLTSSSLIGNDLMVAVIATLIPVILLDWKIKELSIIENHALVWDGLGH